MAAAVFACAPMYTPGPQSNSFGHPAAHDSELNTNTHATQLRCADSVRAEARQVRSYSTLRVWEPHSSQPRARDHTLLTRDPCHIRQQ